MCRARTTEQVQQLSCSECGKKFDGIREIPVDLGNGGLLCLQCDWNERQSDAFADKSVKVADIFKAKEREYESLFIEGGDEIVRTNMERMTEGLRTYQLNENFG